MNKNLLHKMQSKKGMLQINVWKKIQFIKQQKRELSISINIVIKILKDDQLSLMFVAMGRGWLAKEMKTKYLEAFLLKMCGVIRIFSFNLIDIQSKPNISKKPNFLKFCKVQLFNW